MMATIYNSEDWPALPLQRPITKNSKYFRFRNKFIFIDVLNPYITSVYDEILKTCEKCTDINKAFDCAKRITEKNNSDMSTYFNKMYGKDRNIELFFKLQVQKNNVSKKPILFGYYLNWKKFSKFIEKFPESDKITLEDKYKYILACKYSGADLSTDTILKFRNNQNGLTNDSYKRLREKFEKATSTTIDSINNTLDGLISFQINKLEEGKKGKYSYGILDFIPDIISSIDGIKILAMNGYISSCYREMRSLVERISYVVLDEYLTFNSSNIWGKNTISSPFFNINSRWRNKQDRTEITKISDLIPQNLFKGINGKERKDVEDILFNKMSVEMYVALAGKPIEIDNDYVPSLKIDTIKNGIEEIKKIAKGTNDNHLKIVLKSLADDLDKNWEGSKCGEFPFPATTFVFKFLEKIFAKDLKVQNSIWHNYSLFIHPYVFTWEVIPKTSVIEYKILEYEITRNFDTAIEKLFNNLFMHFKENLR